MYNYVDDTKLSPLRGRLAKSAGIRRCTGGESPVRAPVRADTLCPFA